MPFALIVLAVCATNYLILVHSQKTIIEHEALRIAEVTTSQALATLTAYTTFVADKLGRYGIGAHADFPNKKGYIPLPAQFLKMAGREASISSSGLYSYRPLSKWNLEPTQGLQDNFQQWAWSQLEEQDKPAPQQAIAWKPVWRFETVEGVRTVRYMTADAVAKASCVQCHNAIERTPEVFARRISNGVAPGKQWSQYQLLGAIEANIPVGRVEALAATQAQRTLALSVLASLGGLGFASWLALRGIRREHLAAEHFERQSKFDPLTGRGNRMLFDERSAAALAKTQQYGSQLCVMFVDLDRFKQINDTHGHHAGDEVLRQVAQHLVSCLRETDFLTRHGGDEFLVLLEADSQRADFISVARKISLALQPPIQIENVELTLSASIGMSKFPDHGNTLETLLEKADAAMYTAKRRGRNAYLVWSETLPEQDLEGGPVNHSGQ